MDNAKSSVGSWACRQSSYKKAEGIIYNYMILLDTATRCRDLQ